MHDISSVAAGSPAYGVASKSPLAAHQAATLVVGACWLGAIACHLFGLSLLTLLLCFGCLAALLSGLTAAYGMLDYRTLLTFSGSIYAVLGTTDVLLGSNTLALSPTIAALNSFIATSFLIAFGGACMLFGNQSPPREAEAAEESRSVTILIALVTALTVPYLYFVLFISDNSADRVDILAQSSLAYAAVLYAILTGMLVIVHALRHDIYALLGIGGRYLDSGPARLQIAAIVILIFVLALTQMILLGNRREILSFLAAVVVAVGLRRVPMWALPIVGILVWFATLLPWLRQAPLRDWADIILNFSTYFGNFNVSNTEHYAFSIIADVYFTFPTTLDFPTMLDAFGTLVPQAIWPGRPMPAGEWFVATYYPELYRIGGGLAYNFPMETVMNLGLLGPLVVPVALAFIVTKLGSAGKSALVWRAAIVLTALFWLRYDFATLLKSSVLVFPVIAGWLVVQRAAAWTPTIR